MVIIGRKIGQLSNQLFTFSHFIANAIEYDYKLLNPTFGEYRKYFTATSKNDFEKYCISVKFSKLYPIFRHLISAIKRYNLRNSSFHSFIEFHNECDSFDLINKDFFCKNKRKKVLIIEGWAFRDFKNFEKYSEIIRKFFRPVSPYNENIETLISKSKRESDILIGVHIRRGDYKKWRSGIYYYNDDIYYDKMLQIESYFRRSGKKVSFLLCSNEKIHKSNFDSLDINLGTNHFIEDLYSLSRCNYIIGPPSSYSMWASFYGKVPYLHISDSNQKVDITHFKVNCG